MKGLERKMKRIAAAILVVAAVAGGAAFLLPAQNDKIKVGYMTTLSVGAGIIGKPM